MSLAKPIPQCKGVLYRKLKDIDIPVFQENIKCDPKLADSDEDLALLVDAYNAGLLSVLDEHAPCDKKQ